MVPSNGRLRYSVSGVPPATCFERGDDDLTLGDYLRSRRYSKAFIQQFIVPMGAAIWSADPAQFKQFPARYFARFFHNHGFLNIRNQPQWLVIRGGSGQYVEKLIRPFKDRIRLSSPVVSVQRRRSSVEVTAKDGSGRNSIMPSSPPTPTRP